jgi:hypothetical protein
LPPSVTGATPPAAPVLPASGVQAPPDAAQAPIARFQNLQQFPPETVQAVYSMRAGADWLWRMNQSNGRFFPGLNPAVRAPLDVDSDLRQAYATLALVEAARFTGDERFAARATQSVLALLTLTKPDPADPACRVPDAPSDRCNRVGFAALVALAAYQTGDPKLAAEAERLCRFLGKQWRNGAVHYTDGPEDPLKVDPDGVTVYPGLAVQALAASHRAKPEPWKQDALAKAAAHYRAYFKAHPHPMLAATLIPGFTEFCLQAGKDPATAATVFELADWLGGCQYTLTDARNPTWVGGFRPTPATAPQPDEPTHESAVCAAGLAAAAKLTRQTTGDLTRFQKYRQGVVDGLAFVRGLQFTDESADHFEKGFRARFLVGGVHLTPTDGTVRIDATAHLVSAELAYLQSGTE